MCDPELGVVAEGRSPLARGKPSWSACNSSMKGSIPARAGETLPRKPRKTLNLSKSNASSLGRTPNKKRTFVLDQILRRGSKSQDAETTG